MDINQDTRFYVGKFFPHGDSSWRNECVPVALGNYLILYKIPISTIDKILTDMVNSPKYISSVGGFKNYDVPIVIEDSLRKHIDKSIEVIMYQGGENDIPDNYQEKVKNVKLGWKIEGPAIVRTDYDDKEE